ncbi:putative monovalent cation/H+ antiporter subunit A [uncultured Thermanaerothrix sp.]|uniref:putative monovalent cation/H+ antiporter subunit A n=1 Tax=uncultured Thermanaerothrix sp. TaxID=1195149 RepID=UPI002615D91C|nr:putative monovalent cation/H+ antiporter subunit A [uncultured Thermanaerothrix sp.]
MLVIILSGFIFAALIPWLYRRFGPRSGWLFALLPLSWLVYLAGQAPFILGQGQVIEERISWMPSLGVELAFRLDGLGMLFALLITGIGALVIIYGGGYLDGHPYQGRFFVLITLFMVAMLGVVLSDHLFLLFIFWELTSITSFLLIGFEHQRYGARAAAWQALLVTAGGGLALLAGLVLLSQVAGSGLISVINQNGAVVRNSPLYPMVLLLILIGAFTKSAQFPFHFWLPNAMAAPTPVSAYLHSATMVKAGVFLLARLTPVLAETPLWQMLVSGVGFLTLLTGALLALGQRDLKRLLAYTTVGALGTMTFLLGLSDALAVKAAVLYILAHGLYKGALFLVAGAVDHSTGTRDIERLGNLASTVPQVALAALLAGISMAGLPPALGFLAKELFFESLMESTWPLYLSLGGAILAGAINFVVAALVAFKPFWGRAQDVPHPPHPVSVEFWLGPLILSGLGLVVGVIPALTIPLIQGAAQSVLQFPLKVKLALWHGMTPVLGLSLLTMGLGGLGWAIYRSLWQGGRIWQKLAPVGPAHLYEVGLTGLRRFAAWQTRVLQNGYLRFYVMTIVLTTVLLTGFTLLSRLSWLGVGGWGSIRFYEVVVVALMIMAAVVIPRLRSRLATIATMGMIGYGLVLIYLIYSAPDLAMVQFAIETLTVILFVLAVYRLPKFTLLTPSPTRFLDLLVAIAGGMLMTALVLVVTARPMVPHISDYFAQNSLTLANGRNVVNVILVDFRGLDTLGEITVLALAGIGVYALVRLTLGRLMVHFEGLEEEEEVEHERAL